MSNVPLRVDAVGAEQSIRTRALNGTVCRFAISVATWGNWRSSVSRPHGARGREETDRGVRPGAALYFARNAAEPAQVRDLSREVAALSRDWPLWISVDQEGGRVARLRKHSPNGRR